MGKLEFQTQLSEENIPYIIYWNCAGDSPEETKVLTRIGEIIAKTLDVFASELRRKKNEEIPSDKGQQAFPLHEDNYGKEIRKTSSSQENLVCIPQEKLVRESDINIYM